MHEGKTVFVQCLHFSKSKESIIVFVILYGTVPAY